MRQIPCAFVSCLLLPGPLLTAQQRNNAGFGGAYLTAALDPTTGNPGSVGIAVDPGTGNILVSARSASTPPHRIFRLDGRTGALLGSFLQDPAHDGSPWGQRDLETDGANFFGGSEVGVTGFSISGAVVTQVQALNGPRTFSPPIAGAALTALGGVVRGLCWDRAANGGNGAFYGINGTGPLVQFDVQGNVLSTHPAPPGVNWQGFGLALDPVTGNLWVNGDALTGELLEIQRPSFTATGRRIAVSPAGAPGGLSGASNVQNHHEPWPTSFVLAALTQSTGLPGDSDRVSLHRVHLLPNRRGWDEIVLQNAVDGRPLDTATKSYGAGSTLDVRLADPTGTRTGQPAWLFWNVLGAARTDSYTPLGLILPGAGTMWEHRTLNQISTTPSSFVYTSSYTVGQTVRERLPASYPVCAGDIIRVQGIHVEPQHPQVFMSTNEAIFVADAACGITVYASGGNSFNANTTAGFFGVDHHANSRHGRITRVTLSLIGMAAPNDTLVFDLDQIGMADRFDGGNAQALGCRGTYRLACDALCGLDYAFAGNHRTACHQVAENGGFTFTAAHYDAVNGTTKDLTWRFSTFDPGRRFEFSVDTDFGRGISGADMAGIAVTVDTTLSGTLQGVLADDPTDPLRSYVQFQ
ncbi:MAG: hypothetical protein IPK26_13090 [Planctomycetes bacterium]|nr:hypothetical protein [Planctomycetota bacterium]